MNAKDIVSRMMVRALTVALLLGHVGWTLAAETKYEVVVEKDVMVPMRDGVKLATDVYRPTKDGKPIEARLPTILDRRPYNKNGAGGNGKYSAARG